MVSFNVGDVNIFWDAQMGIQRQSHKRLINITVLLLLWFLFSKLHQKLLKTLSCTLPPISSRFANNSSVRGAVGRMEHASGTRSHAGAGASCTCTSLFILAVAFLCMYDFAESLNLCAFLPTVNKIIMLYATGRAEAHVLVLAPTQAHTGGGEGTVGLGSAQTPGSQLCPEFQWMLFGYLWHAKVWFSCFISNMYGGGDAKTRAKKKICVVCMYVCM